MDYKEKGAILSKIIARAWNDPEYKKKLKKHPREIFKESGIQISSGATITVLENTKHEYFFVLPEKPDDEMVEELIVSGGSACHHVTV